MDVIEAKNESGLFKFRKKIAYEFNNKDLLINALTHTSFANEHRYKK
ncbi:MAG: hypothetical protein ACLR4C_02055 [Eubacterium ventriosum]